VISPFFLPVQQVLLLLSLVLPVPPMRTVGRQIVCLPPAAAAAGGAKAESEADADATGRGSVFLFFTSCL